MTAAVFGQATPQTEGSDFATMWFLIQQRLLKIRTITLVRVEACTNGGELAAEGTVDVLPLVNQMSGGRLSTPHGTLYKMLYQRARGGGNAVILDPVKGDIGIAVFCDRDISGVKSARGPANPGSFRTFNFADGIYLGGTLNGTPAQYLQFFAGITLGAPMVNTTGNLAAGTGATGSFSSADGQTVTVQDGIIVGLT